MPEIPIINRFLPISISKICLWGIHRYASNKQNFLRILSPPKKMFSCNNSKISGCVWINDPLSFNLYLNFDHLSKGKISSTHCCSLPNKRWIHWKRRVQVFLEIKSTEEYQHHWASCSKLLIIAFTFAKGSSQYHHANGPIIPSNIICASFFANWWFYLYSHSSSKSHRQFNRWLKLPNY